MSTIVTYDSYLLYTLINKLSKTATDLKIESTNITAKWNYSKRFYDYYLDSLFMKLYWIQGMK